MGTTGFTLFSTGMLDRKVPLMRLCRNMTTYSAETRCLDVVMVPNGTGTLKLCLQAAFLA